MAMSAIDAIAKPIDAKPRPSGTTVISTTSSGPTSVDFQAARRRTLLDRYDKLPARRRPTPGDDRGEPTAPVRQPDGLAADLADDVSGDDEGHVQPREEEGVSRATLFSGPLVDVGSFPAVVVLSFPTDLSIIL